MQEIGIELMKEYRKKDFFMKKVYYNDDKKAGTSQPNVFLVY